MSLQERTKGERKDQTGWMGRERSCRESNREVKRRRITGAGEMMGKECLKGEVREWRVRRIRAEKWGVSKMGNEEKDMRKRKR